MQKSIVLKDLKNPEEVKRLTTYLREAFRDLDPVYTESAPNGSITAARGRIALYNNSGTYTAWINVDGATTWQQLDLDTTIDNLWEIDGSETQLKTADEIDMQSKKIINVTDPTANQDAATKKYADDQDAAMGQAAGGDLTGTYPNPTLAVMPVKMKTGTYTGDGNATKAITGMGFQPKRLDIWPQESGTTYGWKTDQDGTKAMQAHPSGPYYEDDLIISLDAGGFTVGDGTAASSASHFNRNNIVYTYTAWTF